MSSVPSVVFRVESCPYFRDSSESGGMGAPRVFGFGRWNLKRPLAGDITLKVCSFEGESRELRKVPAHFKNAWK